MCGIAGFLGLPAFTEAEEFRGAARRMAATLAHRGPDGDGDWADPQAGIALAQRRLSIVDLSPAGRQPMISHDGSLVLIFNGEIYNFRELRAELESLGHCFRGACDTEVALESFAEWGPRGAVSRFVGMFAFALWDRAERTLWLGRDRMGKKPLYYGWQKGVLLFGSELAALRAHPGFEAELDRDSLSLYLRYRYIPAPYSIYQKIFKLPAGTLLRLRADSPAGAYETAPEPYWSLREVAERGASNRFSDEREALAELELALTEAVRLRMAADVPTGAFLSGGVDSPCIVALMQSMSGRPVKTFSVGFEESKFDESRQAREFARHLGTDHTECRLTAKGALDLIPELPRIYGEPFADSSQLPTYLVSQLARQQVTVALSGDGGDELFGGYRLYTDCARFRERYARLPGFVRRLASFAAGRFPAGPKLRDRFERFAAAVVEDRPEALYRAFVSKFYDPAGLLANAQEPPTAFSDLEARTGAASFVEMMMYLDSAQYLPDDILVKLDRATMAVGLEARCPLLDHRVVELAWRMPLTMKLEGGVGKLILRKLAAKHIPPEWMNRPKLGFTAPIAEWLRGPLRPWAEDMLSADRLRTRGLLSPDVARRLWDDHIRGDCDRSPQLWTLLMLESWQQEFARAQA